jgi:replicative DNA helicase
VMLLYREEYYVAKREPQRGTAEHDAWDIDLRKVQGKATVYLDKARRGPTGIVDLAFNGALTRFSNLAHTMGAR